MQRYNDEANPSHDTVPVKAKGVDRVNSLVADNWLAKMKDDPGNWDTEISLDHDEMWELLFL